MTIRIRSYRGNPNKFEVDIAVELPSGRRVRERVVSPATSRSASQRWAEARVRELLEQKPVLKDAPTLAMHWPHYVELCRSERQKPSTILLKESIFRRWLEPNVGERRLNEITNQEVVRLKLAMRELSPKGANNALNVLSTLLQTAIDPLGVLDAMPCTIRLLKTARSERAFWEPEDYEHLVEAARSLNPETYLVVLLGGEAGLRAGEMVALEQADIDYRRGFLVVQRNEYRGHVGTPKGGRSRRIHLTQRLLEALQEHRHLRSPRVFAVTQKVMAGWVGRAERKAGLPVAHGLHKLRHTFCSHLAMRGAPARSIQELAGHADLSTTLRYMHLSPTATESAIRLLETSGEIMEEAKK